VVPRSIPMILPVSAIFRGLRFPAQEGSSKSDPRKGAVNAGDRKIAVVEALHGRRSPAAKGVPRRTPESPPPPKGARWNAPGPVGFSITGEASPGEDVKWITISED
jgi:hypothetical protein